MSAIFQPEVTSIESQIAQLQAQLAALTEAEQVADGALQALQGAVEKVSSLAPTAIARLKQSVLNLFSGGDNPGNDGNGNLPLEPAPQPNDDGGAEVAIAVEPEQGSSDVDVIAVEPLTGQSSEWASPLATPLCCQLEDCPQSVLAGQSVEIACVVSDAPKKPEYIELIPVSHQVAYQRRHDGEIICCYLGGNNKQKLKLWGEWLCNQHTIGTGFQLREAERLTSFKWEIKIWGMSLKQIERLAESTTTKNPPSNFGDAPSRRVERVAPPAQLNIEVGDIVASQLVPHWQYQVTEVLDNGALNGRRIGMNPPQVFPLNATLVNLVFKAENPVVVVQEPSPIKVADGATIDWETRAKELEVSINKVAPGLYVAYHNYRKLGQVVEKFDADNNSWWENRNQLTMLSQGNGDGQQYAEPHEAAIGLAKFLKLIKDAEEAKADLYGGGYDSLAPQQQIESGDWVELLVNGDRYQVDSVDQEGIHLACDSGNMVVQPDEVKLQFKLPANWQPF